MKSFLKNLIITAISFKIISVIIGGIIFKGGVWELFELSVIYQLLTLILKPILRLIFLPLNLATFGLFSLVINVLLVYILVNITNLMTISPFEFRGFNNLGIYVGSVKFETIPAYFIVAALLSLVQKILTSIFA